MISFAGNVTFPKAQQIRDAALQVPVDRLLIETDSPFLAPVPHRGKRNEPAFVKETARKLGELRGLTDRKKSASRPPAISTIFSNWLKLLKAKFQRRNPPANRVLLVTSRVRFHHFRKN
jgi:TatD DNase family protein